MKLLKMNLKYVIIVMVSAAIISCSKDEGPIGPIGPAGAVGQTGPTGPTGPAGADGLNGGVDGADGADGQNGADGADGTDGADGQDGNANVIATSWSSIASGDWTINATSDTAIASVDAPLITSSVMANNVILVYQRSTIQILNITTVRMLPIVFENESTSFSVNVGALNLMKLRTDGTAVVPPGNSISFRYVIIPPSVMGKSSIDFAKMSYEEVMDHFELDY